MEIKTDNYSFDFVNDEKGCLPVVLHRRVVIKSQSKRGFSIKNRFGYKRGGSKKSIKLFF